MNNKEKSQKKYREVVYSHVFCTCMQGSGLDFMPLSFSYSSKSLRLQILGGPVHNSK